MYMTGFPFGAEARVAVVVTAVPSPHPPAVQPPLVELEAVFGLGQHVHTDSVAPGSDFACQMVHDIRESGAFNGVHLILSRATAR
jgi:hypothetical protein